VVEKMVIDNSEFAICPSSKLVSIKHFGLWHIGLSVPYSGRACCEARCALIQSAWRFLGDVSYPLEQLPVEGVCLDACRKFKIFAVFKFLQDWALNILSSHDLTPYQPCDGEMPSNEFHSGLR